MYYRKYVTSLGLLVLLNPLTAAEKPRRLVHVDDYVPHASEQIPTESVTFSPDGQAIAFVRRRAVRSLPPHQQTAFVPPEVRDDIWVQEAPGRPVRNLTNGASDLSGAWEPQWSPDGAHLAFLSTRGGNVTPWIWNRATGRSNQVTKQGVLMINIGQTCRWFDTRYLWCYAPAQGETSPPQGLAGQIVNAAREVWDQAARGDMTANVADSREFPQTQVRRVLSIDINNGITQSVALTGPNSLAAGPMWYSPDGKAFAYIGTEPTEYGTQILVRMGLPRTIELRWSDGRPIALKAPLPTHVLTTTLTWSPSGRELAFFAYGETPINPFLLFGPAAAEVMPNRRAPMTNPAKLWLIDIDDGRVQSIPTDHLNLGFLGAPQLGWTSAREWVLKVAAPEPALNAIPGAHSFGDQHPAWPTVQDQWHVLSRDGRTRPLITATAILPTALVSIRDGAAFIGVADGELWSIDATRGTHTNLTEAFGPFVTSISVPSDDFLRRSIETLRPDSRGPREIHVLLSTRDGGRYDFDLEAGRATALDSPPPAASFVAFSSASSDAVYLSDTSDGTRLWRVGKARPAELLADMNLYRRELLRGSRQVIEYLTLNGTRERALLLLPIDFQEGRRYPLVVDVYPVSSSFKGTLDASTPIGYPEDFFAAAGYAVIRPSIPANLPEMRQEEGMSIFSLAPAILPAVDRAIAMGFADPDRLFITGHSRGGWTVAGLLAQTTRFKAGVASAGCFADVGVLSCSGGLDRGGLRQRYATQPHAFAMPTALNRGYWPTDVPWWRDTDRSRRNSPISYVDRIQTPLMLVHGDLDVNSDISESEELFRALTSMRKTARLVRYWGEMHAHANPANLRDRYQRTFAWFDEYGDILRDAEGRMIWDGDRVKSRGRERALAPEAFSRFGPASPLVDLVDKRLAGGSARPTSRSSGMK